MTGNPGTPSDVTDTGTRLGRRADRPGPARRGRTGETGETGGTGGTGGRAGSRLSGRRLTPPGLAILAATALAFAVRLFTLTRPGFLTGISEYDDGVYLGAAIRLTQGALPYRDFAFVQPPGMLLLMTPAALVARATTTATALALARVLTVVASTACVPLAGNLVRHRGTLVTIVTCGILAVYPDDIAAAHTLLLEPWMNLCCLLAANAAFSRGRLANPGRLAWAGAALGFAAAVKFWAAVPAAILLVFCLVVRERRARRSWAYLAGVAAGFVLPVAPFALAAPGTFIRSTLLDQASRVGTVIPLSLRLAHLTGLIDVLDSSGRLSLSAGAHSLFAGSMVASIFSVSAGWLPFAVTVIGVAAIAAGYLRNLRRPSPLEWFSLATLVLASVLVLSYSAFFYHYPAFVAPWLALSAGGAAGGLAGSQRFRLLAGGAFTAVILGIAALQVSTVAVLSVPSSAAAGRVIPTGACVVTDETSLLISANRFAAARPGCPDIIDSLATTLVLGDGVSIQAGAAHSARLVAAWQSFLSRADYVWLSDGNTRRIPWTPRLSSWFGKHFRPAGPYIPGTGQLFVRVG
jgi:alpha-1,2-mannosyltransferase